MLHIFSNNFEHQVHFTGSANYTLYFFKIVSHFFPTHTSLTNHTTISTHRQSQLLSIRQSRVTTMKIIFLLILGLFAGSVGSWLKQKRSIAGKIRIGSGTVLMLLGLRLILPQKN